jgi:hypothetical protein
MAIVASSHQSVRIKSPEKQKPHIGARNKNNCYTGVASPVQLGKPVTIICLDSPALQKAPNINKISR